MLQVHDQGVTARHPFRHVQQLLEQLIAIAEPSDILIGQDQPAGKDADLVITKEIPSLEYLCYDFGINHIQTTILGGHIQ